MYYCKNCKTLSKEPKCDKCGRSIIGAKPDDVCFAFKLARFRASMYKKALQNQEVPFLSLPLGASDHNRARAIEEIFVPYEWFEKATEVYSEVFPERFGHKYRRRKK